MTTDTNDVIEAFAIDMTYFALEEFYGWKSS